MNRNGRRDGDKQERNNLQVEDRWEIFFFLFGNIETFFIKNFESIRVTDENRREVYLSKRSSLSFNVSEIHA